MVIRKRFSYQAIHDVLSGLLEEDLHAKRIGSLCNATLGLLHSGRLAICAIGQGLAAARSLKPKHAIKQVDRLLSNPAIEVDDVLARWVPFVIGARTSIVSAVCPELRFRRSKICRIVFTMSVASCGVECAGRMNLRSDMRSYCL